MQCINNVFRLNVDGAINNGRRERSQAFFRLSPKIIIIIIIVIMIIKKHTLLNSSQIEN